MPVRLATEAAEAVPTARRACLSATSHPYATVDDLSGLRTAIRRRFGENADIHNVVRPTLGAINRTIVFDCVQGSARRRLVSREETYEGLVTPFLNSSQQFQIMSLVHAQGFPVPEPIFQYDERDDMGEGYVTAFVPGETMPNRILADPEFGPARKQFAAQAGQLLAHLHSLETKRFDFLAVEPDSIDPVAALRSRLDAYRELHPAVELGLRWLELNKPSPRTPGLVHGDFRLGNLMIDDNGIQAVLDWECCHLGRGEEDVGWLCTRSWRFGRNDRPVAGIAPRRDLYLAYHAAGGKKIDPEEARYWEILGLVRWTIINIMQGYGHVHGGRRGVTFAAMGRNASLIEYDLLMTLKGHFQ